MADPTKGLEFVKLVAVEEKDNYLKCVFDNRVLILKNVNGKIEIERQG